MERLSQRPRFVATQPATMTVKSGGSRVCSEQYLASGLVAFAALLLVFAAFEDITTGSGTTVRMEYAWLVACAAGLIFVAVRLLRAGHQLLGGTSVLAVGAGVWAQRAIGPGIVPGLWAEYIVITGSYLWFVVLAIHLVRLGRRRRTPDASPFA